ncbi:MAG TPA: hypothetical protein VNA18_05440 [Nitrososphaeraceae archaeon]|nr:hypothetical protein [Nitrososphaeraceae archaeon]
MLFYSLIYKETCFNFSTTCLDIYKAFCHLLSNDKINLHDTNSGGYNVNTNGSMGVPSGDNTIEANPVD